ncbi:hypothetical protein GCM10010458_20720 [Microbacterium luteolum]|uniref:Uncharacterized protein n=1 Tax=Microbacterium luteolum TaxID=69367 RepID=A0ABY7XRG3_MICLT|nr:hypothetical protein [Microbacterium luteolum]WDM44741.1 hypothetical protein KV395_16475 [Microbacterium luteolum]
MIDDLSTLLAGFGMLLSAEIVALTVLALGMIAFLSVLFAVIVSTLAVRWFFGLFRSPGTTDGPLPPGSDPSLMR